MINKDSQIPLYRQIMDEMKMQIQNNTYKAGERLPSEAQLMKMYDVSRMTIRLALDGLEKQGFVEKQQGKGTFIRKHKIVQELKSITSWSENLSSQGLNVSSKLIDACEIYADKDTAGKLEIEPDTPVYYIERIKYVENEPIGWGQIWLKKELCPGIIDIEEIRDSVYAVMEEKYSIILQDATEIVEALKANKEISEKTGFKPGTVLIKVTRVTYDNHEVPIEVSVIISRADRYAYKTILRGRN